MPDNSSDPLELSEVVLRRAISLGPAMSSPPTHTTIHENPMFGRDESEAGERSASVRRQHSEPATTRNRVRPALVTRATSIKSTVVKETQNFFGLAEDRSATDQLWKQRGLRMLQKHGKLKQQERPNMMTASLGRPSTLASGFDEIDGSFQPFNQMTTLTDRDRQRQYTFDSSVEDVARSPALRVTFKAVAMASNALKKRFAKKPETSDATEEPKADEYQRTEPMSIDEQALEEDVEDFFVNEEISPKDRDHTDAHTRRPRPAYTIQRQISIREKSIPEKLIQTLLHTDNSNRRELGQGWIDRLLDRRWKNDLSKEEQMAIEDHLDFRPYFTYWITTVQILILIISLSVYGFGYFGIGFIQIKDLVYVKSLSLQQVDYFEPQNFWVGPRYADLIHLGAKFTPCMRKDEKVFEIIELSRVLEGNTGCCIRNDGSGCVQTTQEKCSPLLSIFHKWDNSSLQTIGRSSGPVCGQDPRYCLQPTSVVPYEWPNDITKWPICRKHANTMAMASSNAAHLRCELIGRPCCVGSYGDCHITTREFCDFMKGFFHEEATLCSQVSCMENVCGMIPFYSTDSPNQFYRIWTPIFLHAGLIHLTITVVFQFFIMRDVEKMLGPFRMAIIYMISGIGGYLASAVFLPFRPEVGPAGSIFGVLACFIVQIIKEWKFLDNPWIIVSKMIAVVTFLFLLGLLPWVDNYAHISGFIIGFLLSMALIPDYNIGGQYNKTKKLLQISICLGIVVLIIITLFVMLYKVPIYDIAFFKYLNCIPFTSDWCANQEIRKHRIDIL